MKCKDCNCCFKGYFESRPDVYVCIGVREPFVISDINNECTEYPEKRNVINMKKSSDILLSLDRERLEVFKNANGICVNYKNCEIKDGDFLISTYGTGTDFESACDDYLDKIRGKKLVFNAYGSNRTEVMVIG